MEFSFANYPGEIDVDVTLYYTQDVVDKSLASSSYIWQPIWRFAGETTPQMRQKMIAEFDPIYIEKIEIPNEIIGNTFFVNLIYSGSKNLIWS